MNLNTNCAQSESSSGYLQSKWLEGFIEKVNVAYPRILTECCRFLCSLAGDDTSSVNAER